MRICDDTSESCIHSFEQPEQDECNDNAECCEGRPNRSAPESSPDKRQVFQGDPIEPTSAHSDACGAPGVSAGAEDV
jgi:hypothetical protein